MILFTRQFPIYQQISRRSFRWKRWQKTWAWANMFYPDSFPRHSIETLINILTMQGWTMHAIVWKIRVILLQIFVWIVDLKVRERLTEYLKKDIKYHQVIIEVLVWKRCCHEKDEIWEGGSTSQFSPVMTLRNLEWRRHRHWKNIIMKKFEKWEFQLWVIADYKVGEQKYSPTL